MTKPVDPTPSQPFKDQRIKYPTRTDTFKRKGVVVTWITPKKADEIGQDRFLTEMREIGRRLTNKT